MEKKVTSAPVMGLLIGLLLAVFSLLTYFTNLYTAGWVQWVSLALLLTCFILAVRFHAKEVNYRESFGSLFGFGFKTVAAATVVMIAFVILQSFIFPDIKTRFLEAQRKLSYMRPEANKEQIEQGLDMLDKNYTLMMVLGIIFWMLVVGAVASLIGAAVSKKNQPATDFDNI